MRLVGEALIGRQSGQIAGPPVERRERAACA
jgi:hypothetical protein